MSTITAILEPDADGTLHLPLPPDAPRGKVKVTATVEPVPAGETAVREAAPGGTAAGTPRMRRRNCANSAGCATLFPDPVAWQREQRRERPLPGRD